MLGPTTTDREKTRARITEWIVDRLRSDQKMEPTTDVEPTDQGFVVKTDGFRFLVVVS